MDTKFKTCMDNNTVSSFCGCIKDASCVDEAARDFCDRAGNDDTSRASGDDLAELKKAIKDVDCQGCC